MCQIFTKNLLCDVAEVDDVVTSYVKVIGRPTISLDYDICTRFRGSRAEFWSWAFPV